MGSEHLIIRRLSNDIFQSNCYEGQCQIHLKISEKGYLVYKRVDSYASVYGRFQWELVKKTWLFTCWKSRDKQIVFDSTANFRTHLQKENNFLRHLIFICFLLCMSMLFIPSKEICLFILFKNPLWVWFHRETD